jgi:hypothetical protein
MKMRIRNLAVSTGVLFLLGTIALAQNVTDDVDASPEKRERNITRADEKLFKNFPPPTGAR